MNRDGRTRPAQREQLLYTSCGRSGQRGRSAFGTAPKRKIHERLAKQGDLLHLPARGVLVEEGRCGDEIYLVESGVVMLSKALRDGRRQVIGFRFPGELISSHGDHQSWSMAAHAIAPSRVRRIPWEILHRLLENEPSLCRWLLYRAGDEIAAAQGQLLTVGRRNKEERLATFILEIWHRTKGRSSKPPEVLLAMHRAEIADYLGLTTETVSRVLSQFARDRLIALPHPSRIKLLSPAGLEELALGRQRPARRPAKARHSAS